MPPESLYLSERPETKQLGLVKIYLLSNSPYLAQAWIPKGLGRDFTPSPISPSKSLKDKKRLHAGKECYFAPSAGPFWILPGTVRTKMGALALPPLYSFSTHPRPTLCRRSSPQSPVGQT